MDAVDISFDFVSGFRLMGLMVKNIYYDLWKNENLAIKFTNYALRIALMLNVNKNFFFAYLLISLILTLIFLIVKLIH